MKVGIVGYSGSGKSTVFAWLSGTTPDPAKAQYNPYVTVDFVDMFRRIEATGFKGHYICAWGSIDQMLAGRDYLVARAHEAGIAVV